MVDSKESYKFDLGDKGLRINYLYALIDPLNHPREHPPIDSFGESILGIVSLTEDRINNNNGNFASYPHIDLTLTQLEVCIVSYKT